MTLTFLITSLGMGFAIGAPVLLLINRQSYSQAQLLSNQAALTTQAFLANEQADLQNLALLISQRPTLIRLLDDNDATTLPGYLDTLGEGANLDFILICSGKEQITAFNGNDALAQLCATEVRSGYVLLPSGNDIHLYTSVELELSLQTDDRVLVGKRTSGMLSALQNETGLVYFLIHRDEVINASDPSLASTPAAELLRGTRGSFNASLSQQTLDLNSHSYLVTVLEIDPSLDLKLVSALNVDEQIAVQQNLTRSLILGVATVVVAAFGLGAWQSRRISRPIANLADSAAELRQGNLDAPVNVQSSVFEISQLANTLEDARVTLQHSMEQLQAEKAWIEHLLNSIVEGMLTLDNQNRITFASAGVGKIIGLEPEVLIGKKADDVFITKDDELTFSAQLPNAGQQARVSIRLSDGQERLLSISKTNLLPPVAIDANRALVIRDVSNEEYIHRLLGDFMANITHEFRTPLSALGASSELLLDNLQNLSQTETRELLVSLNLGIINLQTLIDNLIEASSIEAGRFKVSIQLVPFNVILEDASTMIQPLAEKYNLRLEIHPLAESLIVKADHRRTVQVLVNLISNAIKHSPEGGRIRINHAIADQILRVEVTDEGSGIPASLRRNLFRRFSHLDIPNEQAKRGAGLGLSVVKAIVEAQHGEVGMKDQSDDGTSFWFTLPLAGGERTP